MKTILKRGTSLLAAGAIALSVFTSSPAALAATPSPSNTQILQSLQARYGSSMAWKMKGSLAEGNVRYIGVGVNQAGISIRIDCTITYPPFTISCRITIGNSGA